MNTMCKDCARLNNGCEGCEQDFWTGCLLKINDDAVDLPIIEAYFTGYTVPENIKRIASNIVRRFVISGSADGMYIANTIGHVGGCGDGCGNFTSGNAKNYDKIASALINAYGCNIEKYEQDELELMIRTGKIYMTAAVKGLKDRINRCRAERAKPETDGWRKDYLARCIRNAGDAADEIRGWLPDGHKPDYYKPGYINPNA